MKIYVLSDLHTEFSNFELKTQDYDILVLAGDIGVGVNGAKWIKSLNIDKPVIYISGNHEIYRNAVPTIFNKIKKNLSNTNIHFLENEEFIYNEVRFLGCTLWTDFNLTGNPNSQFIASYSMNDYYKIRKAPSYKKLKPYDTAVFHSESVKWLKEKLETPFDGKTIVVTHHAPSERSLEKIDKISPCYASNLEYMMGEKIDLWIHGHTHFIADYNINGTRIISNSRGYVTPGSLMENGVHGFKDDLVIEV